VGAAWAMLMMCALLITRRTRFTTVLGERREDTVMVCAGMSHTTLKTPAGQDMGSLRLGFFNQSQDFDEDFGGELKMITGEIQNAHLWNFLMPIYEKFRSQCPVMRE